MLCLIGLKDDFFNSVRRITYYLTSFIILANKLYLVCIFQLLVEPEEDEIDWWAHCQG